MTYLAVDLGKSRSFSVTKAEPRVPLLPGGVVGEVLAVRLDRDTWQWRVWKRVTVTAQAEPLSALEFDPTMTAMGRVPKGMKVPTTLFMSRRTLARWMGLDSSWCRRLRRGLFVVARGSPLSAKARRNKRYQESCK